MEFLGRWWVAGTVLALACPGVALRELGHGLRKDFLLAEGYTNLNHGSVWLWSKYNDEC